MGFENPLKPFKDIIDKGLKKITPEDKPDEEKDNRDPIFHEEQKEEKWLDKGPEDFKKEEELKKARENVDKAGK